MTRSTIAGAGGIAFGVLMFVAFLVASPPGGTYSESDVADYVASGHRTAVIISIYLVLLAAVGLVCLLARLREAAAGDLALGPIFWGTGLAAAASLAIGWVVVAAVPVAMAFGGSDVTIEPTVAYTITEAGWGITLGAGGILLGLALIVLVLGSRATLPAWLRWTTLVAGIAGVASIAYFPYFLLLVWGLVAGVWLLAAERAPRASAA